MACTVGSTTCAAPTQCGFDPVQQADLCLYTCSVTSDCPDISTDCVDGICVHQGCGGVGDGGVDYAGTLNSSCNSSRFNDGTCVPQSGLNSPGVCLQTGGTTTTACNSYTRCSEASQMCETGWACIPTGSNGGPGNCVEFCEPNGADTCPSGQSCVLQSDGVSGNCQAAAVDAGGGTAPDAGLGECDTTTCTGCPAGQSCYCFDPFDVDGGVLACTVGGIECQFGLPGLCQ
jgi:hypothetical protein